MVRRFEITIGGKKRVVELESGDEGHRVIVDGVARPLQLEAVDAGAWLVRDGNQQTLAYVDGENGKVTVSLRRGGADPVVVHAEVAEARSARVAALVQQARGPAVAGPLTVRSPMPGRVVKLLAR